ncbi:MAG: GspH/FimT family pseudopilin [Caulobacteraceae bacterium]|nr:GspH/FimT family pseudopilin [Caulobacteraceae bacterium]
MSAIGDRIDASAEAGFTLLETLVVVGVLALITALVFPDLRRAYAGLRLEASRSELAADLRLARARAIRSGAGVGFEASEDGREYSAGARDVRLPAALRLDAEPRSIAFGPDGESDGGRLVLTTDEGRSLALRVQAPTGVVLVESAR